MIKHEVWDIKVIKIRKTQQTRVMPIMPWDQDKFLAARKILITMGYRPNNDNINCFTTYFVIKMASIAGGTS
jgi:hypothetical protein